MLKFKVNNFCDRDPVEISASPAHGRIAPTVLLFQSVGAIIFQHSMTPRQAREMAEALIECAAEADAMGVAA